jgi:hypothetical protein
MSNERSSGARLCGGGEGFPCLILVVEGHELARCQMVFGA